MKYIITSKTKKRLLMVSLIITVILILVFSIKNPVFQKVAKSKIKSIDNQYSVSIIYGNLKLQGLKKIIISDLSIKNENLDLLKLDRAEIKISLIKLLFGKIKIKHVNVDNLEMNFYKDSTKCSYNIISKKEKSDTHSVKKTSTDYYKRSTGIFHIVEGIIPSNMRMNNLKLKINYFGSQFRISGKNALIRNNKLSSVFEVENDVSKGNYKIDYKYLPNDNLIEASSTLINGQLVPLPVVDKKYGLYLTGKVIDFSFKMNTSGTKEARFSGKLNFKQTVIYNKRISFDTIFVKNLQTFFQLNASKRRLEIDSSSFIRLNKFLFHPYILFDKTKGKEIIVDFNAPRFKVSDLIESIPKGLLTNLENMKAEGDLAYRLRIEVDLTLPDSLKFYTKLQKYDFRIKSFGNLDFGRLQDEFEYTAFKNGNPVRTFIVGPSNPYFVPIGNIPEWLKQSVIFSEDGAFYYHAGFIPVAIQDALITNIKRKKFARGGSTISMQFVKNAFLSSKKVITRKIEEIIITWLMENYRLLSKDRIFEIYLNIIEWGPNIYGVGEACEFYFTKPLSKLTLAESIFMASVIPRPASFYYAFDQNGQLRSHYNWHYRNVSGRMLKKEVISQYDYDNLLPEVILTGPAKNFLKTFEVQSDSIEYLIPIEK